MLYKLYLCTMVLLRIFFLCAALNPGPYSLLRGDTGPNSLLCEDIGIYSRLREDIGIYSRLREDIGLYSLLREDIGPYSLLREDIGPYSLLREDIGLYALLREVIGLYSLLREEIKHCSVLSFPLKSCSLDSKEVLFLIDCRHEVREQLNFIIQTVNYLRYNRNWTSLNAFYMTYNDKEPTKLEVLTANISGNAKEISNQCNSTISVDELYHMTKQSGTAKQSVLRLSFIFIKIPNDKKEESIHAIENIQHKYNEYDRFFILNFDTTKLDKFDLGEKSPNLRNYFHHTDSFNDIHIIDLFHRICDLKCIDTDLYFDSQNFQRSFYHLNYTNISHNDAVQFCDILYNSYLVSFETYEELDYLVSLILTKINLSSLNDTKSLHILLGLVLAPSKFIFWSSHNPFTFYHKLNYDVSKQCVLFSFHKKAETDTSYFTTKRNIWEYLLPIGCDDILNDTYVVCECHHQMNQEVDFIIQPMIKPDTFGLLNEGDIMHFREGYDSKSLRNINCSLSNYTFNAEKYFCKQTKHTPSLLTYVRISFLEELNASFCKSSCMKFFTVHSEKYIHSRVAIYESRCYSNRPYECISNNITTLQKFQSVFCRNNETVTYKCLHAYDTGCSDNSHLENCENFTCPDDFIKCPNSYCVPLAAAVGEHRTCPLGQEKTLFTQTKVVCTANITLKFLDICIHSNIIKLRKRDLNISDLNICDGQCPRGYSCLTMRSQDKPMPVLKLKLELYNISNSLFPVGNSFFYVPYLHAIDISAPKCKIKNVNKSFESWITTETVILDLSSNEITDSDKFSCIQSMTNLLFVNLSHNSQLTVNDNFTFPNSLEVIDLSHTSVASLHVNSLKNLLNLSTLDLSSTRIKTFENMGLPKYFRLDILNLDGLIITGIKSDFFRGLTVHSMLRSSDFKMCCPQILGHNISTSICIAPNDTISSCKHIVGDELKRFSVWVVGLMTLAGNGIVLIYRIVWSREKIFQTAYGLFVTGLAVADLLMGVYLMIIAAVDRIYADVYVVYDESWRKSFLCSFSGFLSTLSSETSTFLIGLITLDRFIIVTYPFTARDISSRLKCECFILSWVIGFVLALVPVLVPDWQIYSSNGLCLALPLHTNGADNLPGWEFSMAVYVILNFILFLFIALGQVGIFVNVIKQSNIPTMIHCSERRTQDMNIAKKLAFVAVSDFLCWFPIGIMGILSLVDVKFDMEVHLPVSVICQCQSSANVSHLLVSVISKCQLSVSVRHLPVSVICQCQSSANVSHLSVSVISKCQSSVSVRRLPVSVICQCQSSANVSHLSVSVINTCQCQSSVSVSHLPVSVICQCQSSVSVSHLSVSDICQCQSSVSVSHLPVSVTCQCQSSCQTFASVSHLSVSVICQCQSSASVSHLSVSVISKCQSSASLSHLTVSVISKFQLSVSVSHLPVSVICQFQSSTSVSHRPMSVICQCQSSANVSHLSVSVIGQCQSSVSVSHLPMSAICQCQSSANVSHLSVSVICQCQSSANVSHLSLSVICQCQSSVSVSHLSVSVICQCQSSANVSHLSVSVIGQCQSSVSVSHLSVSVISQCQSFASVSHLPVSVVSRSMCTLASFAGRYWP
ncbi:hypothetical protein Btru_048220 [Bulinus truncatus]|nr:hypothetical protein Btru_048220 [Bulinus truncatus]